MRHSLLCLLFCTTLAACSTQPAVTGTATDADVPTGQLPRDVVPQDYDLRLRMDPDATTFSGHAEIHVRLTKPRDVIWLHGWQLRVADARIELADGRSLHATYEQVNDTGLAKVTLPETVAPQDATLTFDYSADYFSGLDGAYRVETGGEWYVFTQFEPVHARRVFPSFDEPAFKTPFNITFEIPASDRIVANTPIVEKKSIGDGMQQYTFEATKPLPTYLIAFAIGPLDIVEGPAIPANAVRDRPVPLRGVATKGKGPQLAYALEHTGEQVAILEDYFGIAYPYQKLDIIAVPDFSAGAMENAGAITFREVLLLIPDPAKAPTWQLDAYAEVMAHELAHQWFGNLVTMPWWDDIWLNEAFASWTETKVMSAWDPEHPVEEGIARTLRYAMWADTFATARQIRQPIDSTHDIENAFDGITYSKGASVLQMFEQYLGEDVFREGVQYHLKRFTYGNADVFDFLESLSHAAGKDIAPAFKSFLFQPGIPLIDAEVNCTDDGVELALSQARYLPLGSRGERDMQWQLPVCVKYGSDGGVQQECVLLDEKQAQFELEAASCPAWLMPNAGGTGYYHWTLDDTAYAKLLAATDELSLLETLSLANGINPAFTAGRIDAATALDAIAPFADSKEYAVAEAPMPLITFVQEHIVADELRDEAAAYARALYADYDLAAEFSPGKAPEDSRALEHHVTVAEFLSDVGKHPGLREAATHAGHAATGFGGDGELHLDAVTPDYFYLALGVAVQESGADFYEHLVALFKASDNALVRGSVLGALGGATDPELTQRTRALLLDPALKRNEVPQLLGAFAREPENREVAWNWLRENYDALVGVMAPDHASRLPGIANGFCSEARAAEVQSFFAARINALPGGPRNLAKAVESIELCTAQKQAQQESANAFFSQR